MRLDEILVGELAALRLADLYRRLRPSTDLGSTRAVLDGHEVIVCAGNDYLGLARHPEVTRAAAAAAERYGAGAGASRLVGGDHVLYRRLETALADFKHAEAALVFATGYMANLGVVTSLAGRDDAVYADKLDHASLYDACRLSGAALTRYRHADRDDLEARLEGRVEAAPTTERTARRALRPSPRRRFIITDGVFSMDGDVAPLRELSRLAAAHACTLIVDDAHGTGVLGDDGRGSCAAAGVTAEVEIGTLSKALGSLGGFVVGSGTLREYLINTARPLIFSTGLPPAALAAAARSLEVLEEESWRQARVLELAARARRELRAIGYDIPDGATPIIPVLVGDEAMALRLSEACLGKGLFVPAIRTPAVPKGGARLRMTVSAAHTAEELDTALAILAAAGRELELLP